MVSTKINIQEYHHTKNNGNRYTVVKLLRLMKHSGRIYNKPEYRMTFEGTFLGCELVVHSEIYQLNLGNRVQYFGALIYSKKGILLNLFNWLSKNIDSE